jgi:hypothetical protein
MRVSVFGRDLEEMATQRTPRPDPEIRSGLHGVDPSPENVDEQIEWLLVSLQETDTGRTHPYPAPDLPLRPRRRRRRRGRVSRYDFAYAVIAVVLGLAVGVLTVLFVNG